LRSAAAGGSRGFDCFHDPARASSGHAGGNTGLGGSGFKFQNVRRTGAIAALDLKASDTGYLASIGPTLQAFFERRNLLLRPLGNTIYVMPPYCVTEPDLVEIYTGMRDTADRLA
jgi:adenosylmethionine-8-amino-7-oxononanoate aminotransferase